MSFSHLRVFCFFYRNTEEFLKWILLKNQTILLTIVSNSNIKPLKILNVLRHLTMCDTTHFPLLIFRPYRDWTGWHVLRVMPLFKLYFFLLKHNKY